MTMNFARTRMRYLFQNRANPNGGLPKQFGHLQSALTYSNITFTYPANSEIIPFPAARKGLLTFGLRLGVIDESLLQHTTC